MAVTAHGERAVGLWWCHCGYQAADHASWVEHLASLPSRPLSPWALDLLARLWKDDTA